MSVRHAFFFFSTKPNLLGSPFSLCANFWFLFSTDGGKQRHGGSHEAILKGVLADEGVEPAYVDLRCCVRWLRNHQWSAVLRGALIAAALTKPSKIPNLGFVAEVSIFLHLFEMLFASYMFLKSHLLHTYF